MPAAHVVRVLRSCFLVAALAACIQPTGAAEPVAVRHVEGTLHGFLTLSSQDGKLLAVGDLTQTAHGNRITSRLVFRFKDGSLDDETTVFSQQRTFRLISDHHIQKGPFFPHPIDLLIDARSGQVTVRSTGKDGTPEVSSQHLDLPPDLANGLVLSIAKNLPQDAPETKLPFIVATPKLRVVTLRILPAGEEPFTIAGSRRKAMRYDLKVELGGVTGVVAPLIGKQPPDLHIWILGGDAPAFVKEEGFTYEGGPILTIQLTSPVWPKPPDAHTVK